MLISAEFVERLFKTSTIQRWTDHVRPMDLTALGKHAHMMTIAWVIGRRAEAEMNGLWQIDWDYLVRASLYELLRISVLTDIKSPVLDVIRDARNKMWQEVNDAVLKKLHPELPEWFLSDMKDYCTDNHGSPDKWNAFLILKAASALATSWEFRLVEHANPHLYDLAQTKANVEQEVRSYQYIPAVLDIHENRNDLGQFTDLCGRLRFQLRWSQTPILPPRPVLDHELIVAFLAYACVAPDGSSKLTKPEMWKRYHAFFGAIFHDLPEVLTRDIISPVKEMGKIGKIVDTIEREWFEKTFRPMLPQRLYFELKFFSLDEFVCKQWPCPDWPDYLQSIDEGREGIEHPGPVIEACDKFTAFMEAYYSTSFGIRSPHLESALYPSPEKLKERIRLNKGYDFSSLYDLFLKRLTSERAAK